MHVAIIICLVLLLNPVPDLSKYSIESKCQRTINIFVCCCCCFFFSYVKFGLLTHDLWNITVSSDETIKLSQTFNSMTMVFKWQQCCTDAILCCLNYYQKYHRIDGKIWSSKIVSNEEPTMANHVELDWNNNRNDNYNNQNDNVNSNQCPPTWDGWLCWDQFGRMNELMERPCPKHIYWDQMVPPCRGYVTKLCDNNGRWFVNNDNREWSNYTMCARDDVSLAPFIIIIIILSKQQFHST